MRPHNISYIFIQACVAILILVGFESVTSMGEEAKNAKRDIPRAVLLSLFIQGVICYLIEYFSANFALNRGYTMTTASGSSAPIGDMMKIVGASLFGPTGGIWFMYIEALDGVLGPHRHDALVHQHRRSRHLCDGPRRRSAFALRPIAWQEPHAASCDLDVGGDLDGHRDFRGHLADGFADGIDRSDRIVDDRAKSSIWYPLLLIPTLDSLKSFRTVCWWSRWPATSARSCSTC